MELIINLLLIALLGTAPVFADTLINFDDIDASAGDVVLDSYHGFTWSNFSAYTSTPGFPGYNNGIVSGPNAAYSGGQNFNTSVTPIVGTIAAAGPFDFLSGYLGSGNYDNLNVTVEGLLNGTLLYSRTVTVGTEGAQLLTFGFDDINQVAFYGSTTSSTSDPYSCGSFNCTQFTLDDLTFAPSHSSPEPSTFALWGLGALAILAMRLAWKSTVPINSYFRKS